MWRVVLVTLLGCGRLGFELVVAGDASIDVPDAVATCSTFGPWSPPQPLSALNTPSLEYRPALSVDQLTLVYQTNVGGNTDHDLHMATRATKADLFGDPQPLTALNSSSSDGQAELSADGLTLYFASNRGGSMQLYRATRATPADKFVSFALVPELAAVEGFGPALTADGRELFFNDDDPSTLQRAVVSGSSITVVGPVVELNAPDAGWSSFLGNDTIFFASTRSGDYDIYTATRDAMGVFGPPALVPGSLPMASDDDPEVSRDGTSLIFASDRGGMLDADLYMMTRSCL